MKTCPASRTVVLTLMLWLTASILCLGQTRESLDRLIAQSITPASGFMERLMNPLMANWDGMRTATGLNLIIDKHLAAETTEEANLACAYLLENVRLPKDQVAVVMMERARSEAANDAQPWKLVYMLRRMEKMIDRNKQGKEVVGFIASYLNDRRFTEPSYRGREAVPREQRRVCDGATSALIPSMTAVLHLLCRAYPSRA